MISVENFKKNFPPPCILCPADGVPLGIGYQRMESKNCNDGATRRSNKF